MGVRLKCKTGQVDAECFLGNGRQQIMDGTTNRSLEREEVRREKGHEQGGEGGRCGYWQCNRMQKLLKYFAKFLHVSHRQFKEL